MAISAAKKNKIKSEKLFTARMALLGGTTMFIESNWDEAARVFLKDGTFTTNLSPSVRRSIAYAYLKAVETGQNPAGIVLGEHVEITREGDDTARITYAGKDA